MVSSLQQKLKTSACNNQTCPKTGNNMVNTELKLLITQSFDNLPYIAACCLKIVKIYLVEICFNIKRKNFLFNGCFEANMVENGNAVLEKIKI